MFRTQSCFVGEERAIKPSRLCLCVCVCVCQLHACVQTAITSVVNRRHFSDGRTGRTSDKAQGGPQACCPERLSHYILATTLAGTSVICCVSWVTLGS